MRQNLPKQQELPSQQQPKIISARKEFACRIASIVGGWLLAGLGVAVAKSGEVPVDAEYTVQSILGSCMAAAGLLLVVGGALPRSPKKQ